MKRIEFIAPVEAMRGNLSGKQDLLYAENDNKAYLGPVGSVNYARNYSPRFIGAKIAKNGKKYFTVRTKSANHLTAKSKKAMALLGGTGAIFGSIMRDKTSELYASLYAQFIELQNAGSKKTFRQSVCDAIRAGLESKLGQIPYAGPRGVVYITNPWRAQGQTPNVSISQEILIKFWSELALSPAAVGYANGLPFLSDGNATTLKAVSIRQDLDLCDIVAVDAKDPATPLTEETFEALTLRSTIEETTPGQNGTCQLLMYNGEFATWDQLVHNGMKLTLDTRRAIFTEYE